MAESFSGSYPISCIISDKFWFHHQERKDISEKSSETSIGIRTYSCSYLNFGGCIDVKEKTRLVT